MHLNNKNLGEKKSQRHYKKKHSTCDGEIISSNDMNISFVRH